MGFNTVEINQVNTTKTSKVQNDRRGLESGLTLKGILRDIGNRKKYQTKSKRAQGSM